jgi:hypothetical protein
MLGHRRAIALRLFLVLAIAVMCAAALAGWKWQKGTAQAGWTWNPDQAAYVQTA